MRIPADHHFRSVGCGPVKTWRQFLRNTAGGTKEKAGQYEEDQSHPIDLRQKQSCPSLSELQLH